MILIQSNYLSQYNNISRGDLHFGNESIDNISPSTKNVFYFNYIEIIRYLRRLKDPLVLLWSVALAEMKYHTSTYKQYNDPKKQRVFINKFWFFDIFFFSNIGFDKNLLEFLFMEYSFNKPQQQTIYNQNNKTNSSDWICDPNLLFDDNNQPDIQNHISINEITDNKQKLNLYLNMSKALIGPHKDMLFNINSRVARLYNSNRPIIKDSTLRFIKNDEVLNDKIYFDKINKWSKGFFSLKIINMFLRFFIFYMGLISMSDVLKFPPMMNGQLYKPKPVNVKNVKLAEFRIPYMPNMRYATLNIIKTHFYRIMLRYNRIEKLPAILKVFNSNALNLGEYYMLNKEWLKKVYVTQKTIEISFERELAPYRDSFIQEIKIHVNTVLWALNLEWLAQKKYTKKKNRRGFMESKNYALKMPYFATIIYHIRKLHKITFKEKVPSRHKLVAEMPAYLQNKDVNKAYKETEAKRKKIVNALNKDPFLFNLFVFYLCYFKKNRKYISLKNKRTRSYDYVYFLMYFFLMHPHHFFFRFPHFSFLFEDETMFNFKRYKQKNKHKYSFNVLNADLWYDNSDPWSW